MYWWVKKHYSIQASFVSSIFYLLAPYHILDVYVRGSTGEVWALAIAPLAFGLATDLVRKKVTILYLFITSGVISLLLLSHSLLGFLFSLGVIVYAVLYSF